MAIKFERVNAGDVLFQKKRVKAGNTTMSRDVIYDVKIIDIDYEAGRATVSWNGNRAETWYRHSIEKLYRSRPKTQPDIWERARIARAAKVPE